MKANRNLLCQTKVWKKKHWGDFVTAPLPHAVFGKLKCFKGERRNKSKNIKWVGDASLSCYLLLYLYFKECEKREQMTAEPVWSHGHHIQIDIHC